MLTNGFRRLLTRCITGLLFLSATPSTSAEQETYYLLDQFAPTEQQMGDWAESYAALVKFAETPEFVGREITKCEKNIRDRLESCHAELPECHERIVVDRPRLLRAFPDNPAYWERFWQVIENGTFGPAPYTKGAYSYPEQALLEGVKNWFSHNLIADGRIDVDKLRRIRIFFRNALQEPHNLVQRMIYIAIQGIALDQTSWALAQASRDRDSEQLRALEKTLAPFNTAQRSWGGMLWAERAYGQAFIANNPNDIARLREEAQNLLPTLGESEQSAQYRVYVKDPAQSHLTYLDLVAELWIPLSSMPWNQLWTEGFAAFDDDVSKIERHPWASYSTTAWRAYLQTEHSAHLATQLLPALADIYAGRVSPGPPSRPAPKNWHWDWVETGHSQVCLTSDHPVVKRSVDFSDGERPARFCINYYDEKTIEALYVR